MGNVSKVISVAPVGFEGHIIEVESDITKGLPSLLIVGLGNKAIDEAKERVKSAIANSLLEYPARRITVNLAPAKLPKDGTLYDLPISLAILSSSGQLQQNELKDSVFAGELALDGTIRPISGAITVAETAKKAGYKNLYIPYDNLPQALLISGINVFGIKSLKQLFLHLKQEVELKPNQILKNINNQTTSHKSYYLDDIYGQEQAKRAMVIAAAGHHNILLTGPPGAGKTLLAKTLSCLLPPLTPEEQLEVTKIHSLNGLSLDNVVINRPFRSPHHTSSVTAIVGGGTKPKPGEISLAHLGVLFLDEIPEYPRSVLESLRQPLEDHVITVARAQTQATFPADFMLVATMNPCPCGYYGDDEHECTCSMTQILSYQKKLSGPLLDRIDMVLSVSRVPNTRLLDDTELSKKQHMQSKDIISNTRDLQYKRYGSNKKYNNLLSSSDIKRMSMLDNNTKVFLDNATEKLKLSARSYFKIIKVARTIADIDGNINISIANIAEALQYRKLT